MLEEVVKDDVDDGAARSEQCRQALRQGLAERQDRHDFALVVEKSGFGVSFRLDNLAPSCHQREIPLRFRMDSFLRDSMSSMK